MVKSKEVVKSIDDYGPDVIYEDLLKGKSNENKNSSKIKTRAQSKDDEWGKYFLDESLSTKEKNKIIEWMEILGAELIENEDEIEETQATVVVNPKRVEDSSRYSKCITMEYFEQCIIQGFKIDENPYIVEEPAQLSDPETQANYSQVESNPKPPPKRSHYSFEEDQKLIQLIQSQKPEIGGNKFYQEIEHLFPGRTWQSLRDRAYKTLKLKDRISNSDDPFVDVETIDSPRFKIGVDSLKETVDTESSGKKAPKVSMNESPRSILKKRPYDSINQSILGSKKVKTSEKVDFESLKRPKSMQDRTREFKDMNLRRQVASSPLLRFGGEFKQTRRKSTASRFPDVPDYMQSGIKQLASMYQVEEKEVCLALFVSNGNWKVARTFLKDKTKESNRKNIFSAYDDKLLSEKLSSMDKNCLRLLEIPESVVEFRDDFEENYDTVADMVDFRGKSIVRDRMNFLIKFDESMRLRLDQLLENDMKSVSKYLNSC